MEKASLFDRINNWVKKSVTIKLLSIGFLILILLIPTAMLQSLIRERQDIRDNAVGEVSSSWGSSQVVGGPVLTVPYLVQVKDEHGNYESVKHFAHFLPDKIEVQGRLVPEKRSRGIYVIMLYRARLEVKGTFSVPDFKETGISESAFLPDEAFISIGLTDLKGVNENVEMLVNGKTLTFGPGIPVHDLFSSGISVKCPVADVTGKDFSFRLNLNGSTHIGFLPFGKETTVKLAAAWGNPSFDGAFLPDSHLVSDTGFTADWKILQLNRNYPQQGLGAFIGSDGVDLKQQDAYSSFGVKLLLPVDEYQKTMRSVKYCLMLIIITFLTFFFVEVLNKKRIHPIQYLLVGFAVCLFYVLLLSLSEQVKFGTAYLISSIAIISLVTYYAKHVFRDGRLTAVFSCLLILLYGFFYSLLQLEDYALLMGSTGLFIILATIMYLTRKVNWYGEEDGQ